MGRLSDLDNRQALDTLYRGSEDPWGTRSIPEKRVRYEELDRFLPRGPFARALDIACGEGDFSLRLVRVAAEVRGMDLSDVVVERARSRYPGVRFVQGDITTLAPEQLGEFDLIAWVDAIYWLSKQTSAAALRRLAEATAGRPVTFLISARIIPPFRADLSFWDGHDFETPSQFLEHVRRAFPQARGVPVQLHLDLARPADLDWAQRATRFGLKVLNGVGRYRWALRLVQRASTVPFLAWLVEPLVVHMAAIVDPGAPPYPRSVEDVTDRFLNRPLAARIVRLLLPTAMTPNQVTAVSCLLGLAAAAGLSLGSWPGLVAGAFLLHLSIVVDCADGQLARAKGLTSQWGEVFDHTSDDLSFLLVSFALGLAVWRSELAPLVKAALVAAGFTAALLLTASQYFYNEEYRTVAARGAGGGVWQDRERILLAGRTQGRGWWGRLGGWLLGYYAFRLGLMHRGLTWLNPWRDRLLERQPVDVTGRRLYWEFQAFPLWLWRLAGMSSVALLLVLICLVGNPLAFAWLMAAAGLPYFAWLLVLQRRADRRTLGAWSR